MISTNNLSHLSFSLSKKCITSHKKMHNPVRFLHFFKKSWSYSSISIFLSPGWRPLVWSWRWRESVCVRMVITAQASPSSSPPCRQGRRTCRSSAPSTASQEMPTSTCRTTLKHSSSTAMTLLLRGELLQQSLAILSAPKSHFLLCTFQIRLWLWASQQTCIVTTALFT